MDKTIKRLELILKFLELEDPDGAVSHIAPLREAAVHDADLAHILSLLDMKAFGKATVSIQAYVSSHQALQRHEDPELAGLRLEAKALERAMVELEEEKAEAEKLLHAFHVRYQKELGPIIEEILRLRRDRLKREAHKSKTATTEYTEAKQEYERFEGEYQKAAKETVVELKVEDTAELKKLYRQACKLCHPDVVADEFKAEAASVFRRLNDAYNANDLPTVRRVLASLEHRGPLARQSDKVNKIDVMRSFVRELRLRMDSLRAAVAAMRTDEAVKLAVAVEAWDEYFKTTRARLVMELEAEKRESAHA